MLAESLTVRNWARVVSHIELMSDELHYVSLVLIRPNGKEEQLRRYRLSTEDEYEQPLTDVYDEEEDDEPSKAVLLWLEGQITDVCLGIPESRLKLRLYGKAEPLKSFTLLVHYADTAPQPPTASTADQVVEEIALRRAEREEETRAGFYEQMLDAMRQLQELQSTAARESVALFGGLVKTFGDELAASRLQVNALVESITSAKIAHAEAQAKTIRQQAEVVAEDQRTRLAQDLGKQAIEQVSQLIGLMAMKQAGVQVEPQLVGVLSSLQQNPHFKGAMQDPGVVETLKDPGNIEFLAGFLKDAADKIKSADQDAAGQHAGPAGATPQPGSPFDNSGGDSAAAST